METIVGVEIKLLKSHGDDRGFFREIVRNTEPVFQGGQFAQWSHSKMVQHTVKAWHYHHVQYDWWYVPMGQVLTILFDNREESPTYKTKLTILMGDSQKFGPETKEACVRIPPGVLHGCEVLSPEAHLFYITSEVYNPQDEGRFPFDCGIVPHTWCKDPITVENDRRHFVPVAERKVRAV